MGRENGKRAGEPEHSKARLIFLIHIYFVNHRVNITDSLRVTRLLFKEVYAGGLFYRAHTLIQPRYSPGIFCMLRAEGTRDDKVMGSQHAKVFSVPGKEPTTMT